MSAREPRDLRCVGGPFDGRVIKTTADVLEVSGFPDMAYHATLPTDTDWRDHIDHDWFIRGVPEPVVPDRVLEWHERGWISPEVAAIRGLLTEASEKFRA